MWEGTGRSPHFLGWRQDTLVCSHGGSLTSDCGPLCLLLSPEKQDNGAFAEFLCKLIVTHLFNKHAFVYVRS